MGRPSFVPVLIRRPSTALAAAACAAFLSGGPACEEKAVPSGSTPGSVIFIHPDGASASHWAACRMLYEGPDGALQWDRLPFMALYRGHLRNKLTATSNGGGTVHAYGVKVDDTAYGIPSGTRVPSRHSGAAEGAAREMAAGSAEEGRVSIMAQAIAAGLRAGTINTGTVTEPGTGCYLASAAKRTDHAEIAAQLVESGAHVVFGAGEEWFLPKGTTGRHAASGKRTDGRNCLQEAEKRGYRIVFTREELAALPAETEKVLGLFAASDTYNDMSEEDLARSGLPPYDPAAPTVAQMTEAALRILGRPGSEFLLVIEEEGTDNFGNSNNARDCLLALRRADEALGVARHFLEGHPRTLILTAADSDAGGLEVLGLPTQIGTDSPLPERDGNGAPVDGRDGTRTPPFLSAPDGAGDRRPFAIVWASGTDLTGGVVSRAEGLNAEWLQRGVPPHRSVAPEALGGTIDNTGIYNLTYYTLFGHWPPDAAAPAWSAAR